ncbi:MAG: prolyl oligopeptidase family serine peptidase [Candidatus Thermoplasmatota archaeon]|nr:prolyl oligopeptidase family serine peptidase [Candidatus Thermoplasmatota archaeon]
MNEMNFEIMDGKVRSYAQEQTEIFEDSFRAQFEHIRPVLRPYVYHKKIKMVAITETKECFVTVEDGKNNLVVNNVNIYSTPGIIVWIKPEKNGERVAIFETSGSDEGTLKVFLDNNLVYSENGFIHDIIFFGDKFYLIKENRVENFEKAEGSSNAVYLDGEYLFGKEVEAGMGIGGDRYGDSVILTAGNNISTTLYEGKIGDHATWKLFKKYGSQVKVLGYENNTLYALKMEGNGVITSGEREFSLSEPVQDAVKLKDGFLVVHMRDAKSVPVLYNNDGRKIKEFPFDGFKGLIAMDSNDEKADIVVGSFGTTFETYSYKDGNLKLEDKNTVSEVKVTESWIEVNEKRVHYFILHAKRDAKNTLVYGYGGFNISIIPSYYNLFAYLLNECVNVVVCNLPGGGEYGEEWHRSGMRENKKNVYESFQGIIRKLSGEGHKIICYGVSNGGLLSSYTLAKIPEYLNGAVIGNPVTDLLRFHKLLAGQYWVSEYGDPDNEEDEHFLREYSSYEQLKAGKYPPSLIYSRISDDRVHPAHALKFYEKIKSFGNEAYLMIGEGGHLGSGMEDVVDETTYIACFIKYAFSKKD